MPATACADAGAMAACGRARPARGDTDGVVPSLAKSTDAAPKSIFVNPDAFDMILRVASELDELQGQVEEQGGGEERWGMGRVTAIVIGTASRTRWQCTGETNM